MALRPPPPHCLPPRSLKMARLQLKNLCSNGMGATSKQEILKTKHCLVFTLAQTDRIRGERPDGKIFELLLSDDKQ